MPETRTPAEMTRDARWVGVLLYLLDEEPPFSPFRPSDTHGWVSHLSIQVNANGLTQMEASEVSEFVAAHSHLLEENRTRQIPEVRISPGAADAARATVARLRNTFPSAVVFERARMGNFPHAYLILAEDSLRRAFDPDTDKVTARLFAGSATNRALAAGGMVRPLAVGVPATWNDIHYAMIRLLADIRKKMLNGDRIDDASTRRSLDLVARKLIETRDNDGLAYLRQRLAGTVLEGASTKAISAHNPLVFDSPSRSGLN